MGTDIVIRFSKCKFTYTTLNIVYPDYLKAKKGKRDHAKEWINKIIPYSTPRMTFDNCKFSLTDENDIKTLLEKVTAVQFEFYNCKFINRSTTTTEKATYQLRKAFGFPFSVYTLPSGRSAINVKRRSFRLKDIPKSVFDNIIVRIVED